jgi:hypothetical protein
MVSLSVCFLTRCVPLKIISSLQVANMQTGGAILLLICIERVLCQLRPLLSEETLKDVTVSFG